MLVGLYITYRTKIGMALSSWLDDYFSWANPSGEYPCCRLLSYTNRSGHIDRADNGTFCNASCKSIV